MYLIQLNIEKDKAGKAMIMNVKCKVVDAPCGAGKTSAAINFINGSDENAKFLFITPFLTEVDRVKECCKGKNFVEPSNGEVSKTESIKGLLKEGKNVVATHSLFRRFDAEILNHISRYGYVLIMDEVTSVIEQVNISDKDKKVILEKYAHIDNSHIIWDDDSYTGVFNDYMTMAKSHRLVTYEGNPITAAWMFLFPVEIFNAFSEIYLLTYMFKAQLQKCYYDYYGISYEYLNVKNENDTYIFTSEAINYHTELYAALIDIEESPKLNAIGDSKYALSSSWYKRASANDMSKLANNTYNFFRNKMGAKSGSVIWTTFSEYISKVKKKGFSKDFLAVNARATNMYQHTYSAAYLVNRFVNPVEKNFFLKMGITYDEDAYALSELIQWLWRTQIRNGKPISLYIPSSRMRGLLKNWLKGNN